MGKQVKGWTPPDEDEVVTEPVAQTGWVPPADDEVLTDPVKKKESPEQGGFDFIEQQRQQFEQPGKPSSKPSEKSTPKSTDTNDWRGISEAAKAVSPIVGAVVDMGRKIASGFTDELPQAVAQGLEVAKSSVNPATAKEFIERVPVDFQRYVREKEGLKWYEAFDQSKYVDKYADSFMEETGRAEIAKNIEQNNPEILARRKEVESYVQKQKAEGAEKMAGATQSYKDVKDLKSLASYIGTLGGNAAYQIPLSVLTKGGSSLLQESATIYDQQLENISKEKGISRQEVIAQGLDKPAEGQAYALLAATLDKVSAGNILKAFKSGGGQMVKKWVSSAVPEAVTEPVQGVLEDVGAGGDLTEALTSSKRIDEALGGLVGGSMGVLGPTKAEAVDQVRNNVDKMDPKSIDAAAVNIEQALNEDVKSQDQNIPENIPTENKVQEIIDQNGNQGNRSIAGTDESGTVSKATEGTGQPGTEETGTGEGETVLPPTVQQGTISDRIESDTGGNVSPEERVTTTQIKDDTFTTTPEQQGIKHDVQVEQPPAGEGPPTKSPDTQAGGKTATETGSVALDQPEEQKLSGIKKALVSQDKVDATPIERRTTEEMLTRAKEQVDSGEVNPKAVVDEIAKGNARALQADEVAGLVYYKTQLDNKSSQLNSEMITAMESGDIDQQTALRPQIDAVEQEIDNYQTMAVKTAYEQSLAFRLRQMLLDNEYNLQSQINKYKVANGGIITPEVEKKFRELDKELKAANAKLKKLEEQQAVSASTEAMQSVRQDLQRQKEKRLKAAEQRKEKINEFFNSLKVKSDPNKLNSITQVIGESVYNGSVEAIRLAVLAGADVATAIQAGVDYVKEHYRGTDFDETQFKSVVQPGLEKLIPSESEIKAPEMRNGKLYIPSSTIKTFVERGAKDINELVDQLHDIVKESLPDVTKREVRDAVTRYGETRNLSKDEIDVKVREIKRMGRLISSLEDVQNKKRPLRSGTQRDKLTDEERRLQRDIKEGMKNLPVDQAEIDKAWKNALDAVKARLRNNITDLENQIKTGEKTPKKAGIKYDDEANTLKEQRDKLKSIIEATEGRQKMSDEQRVRAAVSAVEKTISDLESRIKNQDTSVKQKSSTTETQQLKDLRSRRDKLRSEYQQMEQDLGVAEKKKLAAYKSTVKKAIDRYEQRIKNKDFVVKKPKPLTLDDEAIKLKLERDKIKQQFDLEREKARLANRPMSEKIWDWAQDIWNIPKSLLATIDMSAPFRQGALLSTAHPTSGAKSFVEMFRQAFSENKANEWLLKLKETPEYAVMKQAKLYLAEPTTKLTAKEESFLSNFAGKIPVIGGLVKGSERAYTGYLNKLRVDVFTNGADRLRDQGITSENNPEAYKAWANFINNATGRGNLGGMEMAAPVLNGLFFSPRYVASRFNLLNPVTYAKMPAAVRKMAIKDFASYVGFAVLVLAIAAAAGADVEKDPRSSDFGKIRIGDTRFDIWAGFQQLVRLMAQLLTGQRKNSKTGEITELSKDKFPYETRGDVALRFIRSKLSPSAGTIANLMTGENIVGEEVTLKDEALKNVVPLYLQDIKGIYDEEGPTGLIYTMLPAFFGIGVQSYGAKSGLTNKNIDPEGSIQKLNKERGYSISQPSKGELTESFDHEVDDTLFEKFSEMRDKEIKRLFDRYKGRLEAEKDIQVYDKLMDQIVKEAGRDAKYKISRENKWRETQKKFNPGDPFRLRNYKKNEEGQVVPR